MWRTQIPFAIQEGIPHEVRARAVDQAGNVGAATEAQTFTADNRAPRSAIEEPQAGTEIVGGPKLLIWGHAADGWGIETVEVSIDGGRTWHNALLGADAGRLLGADWPDPVPAEQPGPNAIFLPTVQKHSTLTPGTLWAIELAAPWGDLALRSRATDWAGNVEPLGLPVRIRHIEAGPIGEGEETSGAESAEALRPSAERMSAPENAIGAVLSSAAVQVRMPLGAPAPWRQ
jgi:hypothetical protein